MEKQPLDSSPGSQTLLRSAYHRGGQRKELTASHGLLPTSNQARQRFGHWPIRLAFVPLSGAGGDYEREIEIPSPKTNPKFLMSDGVVISPGSQMKINNLWGVRCQTVCSEKNLCHNLFRELKQTAHFLMRQNETWKWERPLYERAWAWQKKSHWVLSIQNCVTHIFK